MPNGDDEPKNWTRLILLLGAFFRRFGHWPTALRLDHTTRAELRTFLGPSHYRRLLERLEPLPADGRAAWTPLLVRDAGGDELAYGDLTASEDDARMAELWLGIDPHAKPRHKHPPEEGQPLEWDAIGDANGLSASERAARESLADESKAGAWSSVLATLADRPTWVNASRPGGRSRCTALHQAAHHGAKREVVASPVELGGWRLLRTARGETPLDIARRQQHHHPVEALAPRVQAPLEKRDTSVMEAYLHGAISSRVADLVREYQLRLPIGVILAAEGFV